MDTQFWWALLGLAAVATCVQASQKPQDIAEWHILTFSVPDGYPNCVGPYYNPENSTVASDVAIIRGIEPASDKIFLFMPRVHANSGYFYTLGYIPDYIRGNFSCLQDPAIQAYPSWEWHADAENNVKNCSALVSVTHGRIDKCNRLWVLDAGYSGVWDEAKACPPKIVVFDLANDQLVYSIEVPADIACVDSYLVYLALDERYGPGTSCDDLTVYIADAGATTGGIISYDPQTCSFISRYSSETFPDPKKSTFRMPNGETFKFVRSVYAVQPAPALDCECDNHGYPCDNVDIYFVVLTDNRLYRLAIADFNNTQCDSSGLNVTRISYLPSQSGSIGLDDKQREILSAPFTQDNVYRYQPCTNNLMVAVHDTVKNDVVIDLVYDSGCLYTASINLEDYLNGSIDQCVINQRISFWLG